MAASSTYYLNDALDVEGELWAIPLPEHLHIKTTLDIESGHCAVGD
jgi:hypothetical protein